MLDSMERLYSIGKVSKQLGVTTATLRNWHRDGILVPAKITNGKTRYYSEKQIKEYLGISESEEINIEQ